MGQEMIQRNSKTGRKEDEQNRTVENRRWEQTTT